MKVIKKKLISFLERGMRKKAYVVGLRYWAERAIIELDLHVPDMQVESWSSVPHMKIKVAEGVYRDYSPTMWDAETKTCSLIIDAGHDGVGSQWVQQLQTGDIINYVGIGGTPHKVKGKQSIIAIGDESSLGHFIALEQLLGGNKLLPGVIGFSNPVHAEECAAYMRTGLSPIRKGTDIDALANIKDWLAGTPLSDQVIYVAGSLNMVREMKKFISSMPFFSGTVKGQGFWK